mmetsp:Transcript_22213/g.61423  ORF Transcript_22213/g.61423 Transcript_22213/m.61423 type:complete len:442 (+) Transcript_22213:85-1410(+)
MHKLFRALDPKSNGSSNKNKKKQQHHHHQQEPEQQPANGCGELITQVKPISCNKGCVCKDCGRLLSDSIQQQHHLRPSAGHQLFSENSNNQQTHHEGGRESSCDALAMSCSKEERRKWINHAQDQAFAWDFDVFDFGQRTQGNPLISMTIALLELHNLMEGWKVNRQTVENFLLRVEAGYSANSYHNNVHATDVTQTAAIILGALAKQVDEIPKMDVFCIIMASAVHDLGHLGVNNDFLINSRHPRATTYNDKSVNENYHIARAFELARTNKGCDIFELFTFDEQKKCRQLMIDVVLATDMAIHFELLKNFNSQMEAVPDVNQWEDRNLLYRMIVHLADIANPSRPFGLARPWAERVIQEFCEQGDKEQQAGLSVSPFCNKATMNMPRAQLGFIDIFVKPTLQAFEGAAPEFIRMALQELENTISEWKKLEQAGVRMPAGL